MYSCRGGHARLLLLHLYFFAVASVEASLTPILKIASVRQFPGKDCDSRARNAGLKVGDVITSVSGVFGDDMVPVMGKGVERVQDLIAGRMQESDEKLVIEVLRNTDVLARHKATLDAEVQQSLEAGEVAEEINFDDINQDAAFLDKNKRGDVDETADGDCVVNYESDKLIDKIWIDCGDDAGDGSSGEESGAEGPESGAKAEKKKSVDQYELWRTGYGGPTRK